MKKYFLLFALILIFAVSACGKKSENTTTPGQNDADETAVTNDEDADTDSYSDFEHGDEYPGQDDTDETAETEDHEQNEADVEEDSDITPDSEQSDDDAGTPEQPDGDMPECSPSSETPCVDASSGLIWSAAKKESDKMDWEAAVSYCNDLSEGGFDDWHLPTINELRTLVQNCDTTALGGACKIDDPNCLYYDCNTDNGCSKDNSGTYSKFGDPGALWSSSVMLEDPSSSTYDDFVWVLNFKTAGIIFMLKEYKYDGSILYLDLHVRCVR